jgi:hypothetical protein
VSLARLIRMAGSVSVVAAALIVISEIVAFLSGDVGLINGVVRVVAFFLLLIGLVGLYVRQSEKAGKLGLVGFLVAFLGTTLIEGDLWATNLEGRVKALEGSGSRCPQCGFDGDWSKVKPRVETRRAGDGRRPEYCDTCGRPLRIVLTWGDER